MTSPTEYALGLCKALKILIWDSGILSQPTSSHDSLLAEVNLMINEASLALIIDDILIRGTFRYTGDAYIMVAG